MKAAASEERLQATSANNRDKRVTLRDSADGKLSFNDLSHIFDLSRQRIEGFVNDGREIMTTVEPLLTEVSILGGTVDPPLRRLGSPELFTSVHPTAHKDTETGEVTRVCICCEALIEPDDPEMVIAILDRNEVAWCSRECANDLTIDAYLVSNRHRRHWASVALSKDKIDERSRVREVTQERMATLESLAIEQGY